MSHCEPTLINEHFENIFLESTMSTAECIIPEGRGGGGTHRYIEGRGVQLSHSVSNEV